MVRRFKGVAILLIMMITIVSLCTGCGSAKPAEAPTPSRAPVPTGPIEIDSAIVGQWVPVGVQGSGYMQFTHDGRMIRFTEQENAAPIIEEQGYYLTGDNTFCMIHNSGTVSDDYEFEVINDGKTLNIYDPRLSIRMASEFYRID